MDRMVLCGCQHGGSHEKLNSCENEGGGKALASCCEIDSVITQKPAGAAVIWLPSNTFKVFRWLVEGGCDGIEILA